MNELDDHQMEVYFNATENTGGLICEDEAVDMDTVFDTMREIHNKAFQDVGGRYKKRDKNEKTCAIRLPHTVFFQVLFVGGVLVLLS